MAVHFLRAIINGSRGCGVGRRFVVKRFVNIFTKGVSSGRNLNRPIIGSKREVKGSQFLNDRYQLVSSTSPNLASARSSGSKSRLARGF